MLQAMSICLGSVSRRWEPITLAPGSGDQTPWWSSDKVVTATEKWGIFATFLEVQCEVFVNLCLTIPSLFLGRYAPENASGSLGCWVACFENFCGSWRGILGLDMSSLQVDNSVWKGLRRLMPGSITDFSCKNRVINYIRISCSEQLDMV